MTGRPILFSAPMVRALLDGRKTQTRRILKPQPRWDDAGQTPGGFSHGAGWSWAGLSFWKDATEFGRQAAQYVRIKTGDRLWVRESLKRAPDLWAYSADGAQVGWPARQALAYKQQDYAPSIHMPKAASRLTLTVTDVSVQRLQEISEADAQAEGIERLKSGRGCYDPLLGHAHVRLGIWHPNAVAAFRGLWGDINGTGSWEANPWVAAYTFTVERRNIDEVGR